MKTRSVKYLKDLEILVIGNTKLCFSVIDILSALGAQVRHRDDIGDQSEYTQFERFDAVVCDRIRQGSDPIYRGLVEKILSGSVRTKVRTWVSVTPFGLDGPYSSYHGSDLVCAAAGGLLSAVRNAKGEVQSMPGEQALKIVAQIGALSMLHGISLQRDRDSPVHIDVSAQEAVIFCSVQQEMLHILFNCGGLSGSERYAPPTGLYRCSDGLIRVVVLEDHQFRRMAHALGCVELFDSFKTSVDRHANAGVINEIVQEWAGVRTKDECETTLQHSGVPATAVRSIEEVLETNQFRSRRWRSRTESGSDFDLPALVEEGIPAGETIPNVQRSMSDLRVLEISNVLAGPLTGAILGAMGAEVIRFEDREHLDVYRVSGPFADGVPNPERAAYFQGANYFKRSVTVDVARQQGLMQAAFRWGNVLIENLGARQLERFGVFPSMWVGSEEGGLAISISGFGRNGPNADFKGYAPNVHAYAGLEELLRRNAKGDVTVRTALADLSTAVWATTIAAAWWLGAMTDQERVDLSMAEIIAMKVDAIRTDEGLGSSDERKQRDLVIPIGDGRYVAVTLTSSGEYSTVMAALGEMMTASSVANRSSTIEVIARSAFDDPDATVRFLQDAGIAAYMVRDPTGLVTDPQLIARSFMVHAMHPVLGSTKVLSLPWKVAEEVRREYQSAPVLGSANEWARRTLLR